MKEYITPWQYEGQVQMARSTVWLVSYEDIVQSATFPGSWRQYITEYNRGMMYTAKHQVWLYITAEMG